MKTILTLVLFLSIGFVGSRGWVSRVRVGSPFAGVFVTGIEFFFIGIILGPGFLNIISVDALQDLKPLVYLVLGWTGLLFGIQLSWTDLKRVSHAVFKMIVLESVFFMCLFAGIFILLLSLVVPHLQRIEIAHSSIIFAITASISSPTIIAVLARSIPSRGKFTNTIKVITSLSALVPLLAFGIFFIITHPSLIGAFRIEQGLLWWFFANAVGVILGFVMVLLTAQKCPEDERLLLVIGFVMLIGGICYFLQLSSLYTAMMMGIVVGNFSRRKDQIFKQLLQLEKTIFIVFLILVGAMISLKNSMLVVLLLAYLIVRLLLKIVVSRRVLLICFPDFCGTGKLCGLVLVGQGGMALAMALDYWMSARGTFVDTLAAVVVLAVVCNEMVGFSFTRIALQASGDTARSKKPAPGEGVG